MSGEIHEVSAAIGELKASVSGIKDDVAELKQMMASHMTASREFREEVVTQMGGHENRIAAVEQVTANHESIKRKAVVGLIAAGGVGGAGSGGLITFIKGLLP